MRPLDRYIRDQLTNQLVSIGETVSAEVITIVSPIMPGLELRIRSAIESLSRDNQSVAIILQTLGGVAEVVERMVTTIRYTFDEVIVIVPNYAMSAGTIFALSADRIMMDHLSCLGPIDPQIERDGKLVPALSYLRQFERLNEKAQEGALTTAEYALLNKLDLGELYQFERARQLSVDLLIRWLTQYKFKNWSHTETRNLPVTEEMKFSRANEIADSLNDPEKWHSHSRSIDIETLRGEKIKLKIENFEDNQELYKQIRSYFELLQDYMHREQLNTFVHTKEYF